MEKARKKRWERVKNGRSTMVGFPLGFSNIRLSRVKMHNDGISMDFLDGIIGYNTLSFVMKYSRLKRISPALEDFLIDNTTP